MPKVSVIIPVYNAEKYLERCLNSVINQTLEDIEIICIDDCSIDNSLEILNLYAQKDVRIKIIKQKINGGESKARNTGIDNAIGEYLAFLDNDDEIDLDFYEKLYNKAIETNAQVCRGDVIHHDVVTGNIIKNDINELYKKSGCRMYFSTTWWTAIYKRDFINENNFRLPEGVVLGGDILFLNQVMIKTKRFSVVDGTFYHYYRRPDSGDSQLLTIEKIKSATGVYNEIIKNTNKAYKEKLICDEDYDYVFSFWFVSTIIQSMRNPEYEFKKICAEAAIKQYKQCLRYDAVDKKLKENYISLFDYIKNGETESLTNYFCKVKNQASIKLENMRYKIRNDMKNA